MHHRSTTSHPITTAALAAALTLACVACRQDPRGDKTSPPTANDGVVASAPRNAGDLDDGAARDQPNAPPTRDGDADRSDASSPSAPSDAAPDTEPRAATSPPAQQSGDRAAQRGGSRDGGASASRSSGSESGPDGGMVFRNGPGAVELTRKAEAEVRVGQTYRYSLVATNIADVPVHDVTLVEILPAQFAFDSASPSPDERAGGDEQPQSADRPAQGGEQNKQEAQQQQQQQEQEQEQQDDPGRRSGSPSQHHQLRWQLGSLAPGETQTVEITGVIQQEGDVMICGFACFEPVACTTITAVRPELRIARRIVDDSDEPIDSAYACEPIFIHYQVTNTGTAASRATQVEEQLPDWIRTAEGESRVALDVGEIPPGETVEQRVALRPEGSGTFENVATATAGDVEARSRRRAVRVLRPELRLSLQAPPRAYIGRDVTFRASVENTSEYPALDAAVRFELPEGARDVVASGGELQERTITIGEIGPGETSGVEIAFRIDEPQRAEVGAIAAALCAETERTSSAVEIEGVVATQVVVVDRQDPIAIGETTVYEIKIWNEGTSMLRAMRLGGTLPDTLSFVRGDGDTEVTASGAEISFGAVEDFEAGAVVSWNVEVRGEKSGRAAFELSMEADGQQLDVVSMEPTTVLK